MEKKYAFITSSTYRQKVLTGLKRGPKSVTDLAELLKIKRPHVSKTLRELEKAGFVACLTPKQKTRIYALTEDGEWASTYAVLNPEKTIIEMIGNLFARENIPYTKNTGLFESVAVPDFVVPSLKTPKVVIEVKSFDDTKLKSAAFEALELKRHNNLKFVVVVVGPNRTEDKVFLKLKEAEVFTIFDETELDKLISFVKKELAH